MLCLAQQKAQTTSDVFRVTNLFVGLEHHPFASSRRFGMFLSRRHARSLSNVCGCWILRVHFLRTRFRIASVGSLLRWQTESDKYRSFVAEKVFFGDIRKFDSIDIVDKDDIGKAGILLVLVGASCRATHSASFSGRLGQRLCSRCGFSPGDASFF